VVAAWDGKPGTSPAKSWGLEGGYIMIHTDS